MFYPLRIGNLLLAVIGTGLMAGFFATYSFNVNDAMLKLTGAEYVKMQSLFNENVRHAGFFLLFFGTGIVLVLSTVLRFNNTKGFSFWCLLMATVLYIAVIIIYTRVHILPINYTVESWDLSAIPESWIALRDEWNKANLIRSVVGIIVFALTLMSLSDELSKRSPESV